MNAFFTWRVLEVEMLLHWIVRLLAKILFFLKKTIIPVCEIVFAFLKNKKITSLQHRPSASTNKHTISKNAVSYHARSVLPHRAATPICYYCWNFQTTLSIPRADRHQRSSSTSQHSPLLFQPIDLPNHNLLCSQNQHSYHELAVPS